VLPNLALIIAVSLGVFFVAVGPIAATVHELGHAFAGLAFGSKDVLVLVCGANLDTRPFEIGRLSIALALHLGIWPSETRIVGRREMRPEQRALIAASGPLGSLMLAAQCGPVTWLLRNARPLLLVPELILGGWSLLLVVLELWPRTNRDGVWSDGKVILDVLQGGSGQRQHRKGGDNET
jgi:hypothetical protein